MGGMKEKASMTILKKFALGILCVVILVFGYIGVEYYDNKKLINTVLHHKIDTSFYIREFYAIDHAKTAKQLESKLKHTLSALQSFQDELNALSLYTPIAKDIRHEYAMGVQSLEQNLVKLQSLQSPKDLTTLKQDIKQSEQILLNAREKLFNLSKRYSLEVVLKMG